jgi:hypothetical protein
LGNSLLVPAYCFKSVGRNSIAILLFKKIKTISHSLLRNTLFIIFVLLYGPLVYGQKTQLVASERAKKRLPVLNKNTVLTALQTQNAFVEKFKVFPFQLDRFEISYHPRFVQVHATKDYLGNLGYTAYFGLFDLASQKFYALKTEIVAPKERFKKSVLSSRKLIGAILEEQQLSALDLPYTISNVYRDTVGLYFDVNIQTEAKRVTIKIDHRFENNITRVILLE